MGEKEELLDKARKSYAERTNIEAKSMAIHKTRLEKENQLRELKKEYEDLENVK